MLTETQTETFCQIADENGACFEPEEITTTNDTVADFARQYGAAHEVDGDMLIWRSVQSAKGQQRRDLFVMDFGPFRAAKAI